MRGVGKLLLINFLVSASSSVVLHEEPLVLEGWNKLADEVHGSTTLKMRFALKLQNLDDLAKIAARVSDPQSSKYGQYLTASQIQELVAPKSEHRSAVEQWLSESSIPYEVVNGEVIEASITVEAAKALLKTNFHYMLHRGHGQSALRAGNFELPRKINDAVAAVYGLHGLPLPPKKLEVSASPANVTPAVIASTYKIPALTGSGSEQNRQAVAEFQGQTLAPSDLVSFFKRYNPSAVDTVSKFVGDKGTGTTGVEAGLDIEYIMGVAPDVKSEFWYWGGNDFCADLKNWTDAIISATNPPLVHSVSYGWQGDLSQIGCKDANVQDIDANFQKLAAMGITIIFASGDSGSGYTISCSDGLANTGVTGTKLYTFQVPDASTCCQYNGFFGGKAWEWTSNACTIYSTLTGTVARTGSTAGGPSLQQARIYPSWPASSPWVTSVGGTRFQNQQVGQPEMATDQFGSGGGFSSMFKAFDAQKAVVQKYLQTADNLPPSTLFDATGRGTPDVSALGEGYMVIANGKWQPVGGTSASTPAFAGMISLLNEERLKAGKPAMGYLNPFLYQNADAFTDVTVGTNAISRAGQTVKFGFDTAKGWDPATGLGTPIFSNLLSAAMGAADSHVVV